MLNSRESYASELREAAHLYRNLGWSVIPIWGDSQPEKPKAAAINWSDFQYRRPTSEEIDSWFADDRYGGLALVCGSVSQLAVLDFDREDMAEAFARCCPDLAQTFTIRSGGRGLPHYYYRVAPGLKLLNKRINGADFQAQSTYVVAPPTMIAGKRWDVSQDFDLVTLSKHSFSRIRAFLETYRAVEMREFAQNFPRDVAAVEIMGSSGQQHLVGILGEALPPISDSAIRSWYQKLALEMGRNNALLKIAIYLRDSGWVQDEVADRLVEMHIIQPPGSTHAVETPQMRRREAVMTITSAFKRPARQPLRKAISKAIPNSIREKFLQLGSAAAARVLDGLLMSGVKAGMVFTERIACTWLKIYGIGRRAVQDALHTVAPNGEPIFAPIEDAAPPVNPPKAKIANAAHSHSDKQKKCAFVRGAKRVINKTKERGCPSRWHLMPDTAALCRMMGVQLTPGDPIRAEDLKSPKAYRQALQRALFQRRPGVYSREWLCQRLGISVWTCRRYDRQIGLQVASKYHQTLLTWDTARSLPATRKAANGLFIEHKGQRFPPIQGLAFSLLRRFRKLLLTRQHWNFYRYGPRQLDLMPQAPAERVRSNRYSEKIHNKIRPVPKQEHQFDNPPSIEPFQPREALWLCPHCLHTEIKVDMPGECTRCQHIAWQFIPESTWRDPERCKKWWRKLWNDKHRKPGKAQTLAEKLPHLKPYEAALADRLYETVKAMNPDRALARGLAYEQVQKYGVKLVEWVLRQLNERANIVNPAGFVITVLRSEHKFGHLR